MGKCKNITRLLSDALDRPLTTGEWIAVGLHLPTCSGCRNYRKQSVCCGRHRVRSAASTASSEVRSEE